MRVRAFLLLKDPPAPDVEVHRVALGQASDGIFVADEFPCDARFGIFLELEVGPEESGDFAVAVLLSSIDLPVESDRFPAGAFELVDERTFSMPPATPGWPMPRTYWVSMEADFHLPHEVDVLLWLAIDDRVGSPRPLLFRSAPKIPPAL